MTTAQPAFTPGTWGIFASSKTRGTQVRSSMGDGTFTTICYALNGDADGRLIAAAPELYETLEVCNAAMGDGRFNRVLAKARGEPSPQPLPKTQEGKEQRDPLPGERFMWNKDEVVVIAVIRGIGEAIKFKRLRDDQALQRGLASFLRMAEKCK